MSLNYPGPLFPGGYSWEFLVGGSVPLRFSKSWPYFRPKYLFFYTRFQLRLTKSTPRSRAGLEEILLSSFRFRAQTKRFLKIHLEFAYYLFFLIHLELKWQLRSYTPVGPSKIISDSRPKWGNSVPFSDWIGPKPYPLGRHMPVRHILENTPWASFQRSAPRIIFRIECKEIQFKTSWYCYVYINASSLSSAPFICCCTFAQDVLTMRILIFLSIFPLASLPSGK